MAEVEALLRELFAARDVTEAVSCAQELGAGSTEQLVSRGLDMALDKTERDRMQLSTLLVHLQAAHACTSADIEAGVATWMESLDDVIIDVPHAPQHVTDFVCRLEASACVSATFARNARTKCSEVAAAARQQRQGHATGGACSQSRTSLHGTPVSPAAEAPAASTAPVAPWLLAQRLFRVGASMPRLSCTGLASTSSSSPSTSPLITASYEALN